MTTANTANNATSNSQTQWNIKRLLSWTTDYLQQAGIEDARLSAEILLGYVLGLQRIELYVKYNYCPAQTELAEFKQLIKRCKAHEPVAYLTGRAHFFSMELTVSPDVLIPRPETETLVSKAIDFLRFENNRPRQEVLDLCTGSGCIALALANNVIEASITASDISAPALKIARQNIEKYDLQKRIKLIQSDLFDNLSDIEPGVYDLIVSNPPYISEPEYQNLPENIRLYEPSSALLAGADGLMYYRSIIDRAESFMADNSAIMLETSYNQAEAVAELCKAAGYLKDINIVKDNLGHNRLVTARIR